MLLGVFVFPLLFQPLHETKHCKQPAISVKCLDYSMVGADSHISGSCPICDFQFLVNDIPQISVFRAAVPCIVRPFADLKPSSYSLQNISPKTPRAPPV